MSRFEGGTQHIAGSVAPDGSPPAQNIFPEHIDISQSVPDSAPRSALNNAREQFERAICTIEGITVRKGVEAVLKRFQLLAETSRDIILFIRQHDGRIIEANPAAARTYGYTREELLSMRIYDLRDSDGEAKRQMADAALSGTLFETVHIGKDGRKIPVEVSSRGAIIGGDRVLLSIIRDISERRHAEELSQKQQAALAHLSRLTAAGEMASTLAHELNQPLGAICNYAGVCLDLIHSAESRPEMLLDALQEIRKEAVRAGNIIGRVRAFVRKQDPQRQQVDINAVVREATDLMSFRLRQGQVRVQLELTGELPTVWADSVQIQQVLVNLIQNAVDAMEPIDPAQRHLWIRTARAEPASVRISVVDTGPGIAPDMIGRVFEPFHTTKPNGLGMGLAISRSIIERHGGRLTAAENSDRGVTFEFVLPSIVVDVRDEQRS